MVYTRIDPIRQDCSRKGGRMPWDERVTMDLRHEFVTLAQQEGVNIQQLCRRFGISRPTGYKWLTRYATDGVAGLTDRSRRPRTTPGRTPAWLEARVVQVRQQFPTWGGRKIRAYLARQGMEPLPSPSTITRILERHGLLELTMASRQGPFQRFEAAAPNDLWQLDFKGHFSLSEGRCHPLSILDDHSRYLLGLVACADQRQTTVQTQLIRVFQRFGLPRRILSDNGSPWGTTGNGGLNGLEVWLLQLGIALSHGRAYHPQTQGKVERFHRTLKADLLTGSHFPDLDQVQVAFDRFRLHYNTERPHEALDLAVPSSRYRPSPRAYSSTMPRIEYAPEEEVRIIQQDGKLTYRGRRYRVSRGLRGQRVALRLTHDAQVVDVYLGRHHLTSLQLDVDRNV